MIGLQDLQRKHQNIKLLTAIVLLIIFVGYLFLYSIFPVLGKDILVKLNYKSGFNNEKSYILGLFLLFTLILIEYYGYVLSNKPFLPNTIWDRNKQTKKIWLQRLLFVLFNSLSLVSFFFFIYGIRILDQIAKGLWYIHGGYLLISIVIIQVIFSYTNRLKQNIIDVEKRTKEEFEKLLMSEPIERIEKTNKEDKEDKAVNIIKLSEKTKVDNSKKTKPTIIAKLDEKQKIVKKETPEEDKTQEVKKPENENLKEKIKEASKKIVINTRD